MLNRIGSLDSNVGFFILITISSCGSSLPTLPSAGTEVTSDMVTDVQKETGDAEDLLISNDESYSGSSSVFIGEIDCTINDFSNVLTSSEEEEFTQLFEDTFISESQSNSSGTSGTISAEIDGGRIYISDENDSNGITYSYIGPASSDGTFMVSGIVSEPYGDSAIVFRYICSGEHSRSSVELTDCRVTLQNTTDDYSITCNI